EWDDDGLMLTIRRRHAHSWVEVYDPRGGWYTVDPTPPQDGAAAGGTGLAGLVAAFENLWRRVMGFDAKTRDALLEWLAALPQAAWAGAREHWLTTSASLLLLLVLGRLHAQRRRPPAPIRH